MDNENKAIGAAGNTPVVRPAVPYEDDGIDLGEYIAILRKAWWKIALFSLAVGIATLVAMFWLPNIYQATAVITPATDEKRPNPALGALASLGVDIGSPTKVEDLETLFKSNDLTVRVFRKFNLWQTVFPDRFDPATGRMKVCWTDRLFRGEKAPRGARRFHGRPGETPPGPPDEGRQGHHPDPVPDRGDDGRADRAVLIDGIGSRENRADPLLPQIHLAVRDVSYLLTTNEFIT